MYVVRYITLSIEGDTTAGQSLMYNPGENNCTACCQYNHYTLKFFI